MTMDRALDLDRYPLDRLGEGPGLALLDRCRAALEETGACVLEGFLRGPDCERIVAEIGSNLEQAHFKRKTHNPYLVADDPAFAADHPRNRMQVTSSATLAYDLIPRGSLLDRLYRWPVFVDFIARVLGFDALHPYADPLSPLNVLVYKEGAETGWHFDSASFVITLLLQEPEGGGDFDYAPFIRSDRDERYEEIGEVLEGRSDRVQALRQTAGALVLFKGSRTLHRVTAVTGIRPRLVAVFSYAPEPGRALDPHTRQTFYGRVA